ncbi:MAG: thrombospondin type 3 repeat-containing protein [Hydrogenophilales bacterium]|nr:thrombospondin type 3 repeat-containing protein [Hydrogenophilales bacterium]
MTLQNAAGQFPNPNGSWDAEVDHAYAILVLQRSLGGACADGDNDGVCDDEDNCPADANSNQADADGDGVGDVCDNCKNTANPGQEDQNQNGIGDACEGKCDVDKDGDIDKVDTSMISKARGKKVPPLDQAYDANGDGVVSPADVKACIPLCTLPNCAVPVNPVP